MESIRSAGVASAPVPSVLRGFSAPVKLDLPRTDAELAFLAANDDDPFNKRAGMVKVAAVLGGAIA